MSEAGGGDRLQRSRVAALAADPEAVAGVGPGQQPVELLVEQALVGGLVAATSATVTHDVAMDADGEAVVAWCSIDVVSGQLAILVRRDGADGSAIDAAPLTVSATGLHLSDGSGAALAADASGALTVSWSARDPAVDPVRDLVFLRRYPAP